MSKQEERKWRYVWTKAFICVPKKRRV